ncbi:MAG: 2-C-methyl-D-erythritol 2,4-cyclodiphosphate synthase [Puniceicoccales bacterium]|nr:2-C-methyl-D-erythritol 2,4-cyclodiphosphate synthase [Puniceicoccales bacterium]
MVKIKIGIGYDIHRLDFGRKLILGGVEIEYARGLVGHSDADALSHAIADAILGALGLPNIGEVFPDTEAWTEGIASGVILDYAREKICEHNFTISNIDAVIIAQEPKLSGYLQQMRSSIGEVLAVQAENIGLKATTNEGFGAIGNGEAIAAIANVLLMSR